MNILEEISHDLQGEKQAAFLGVVKTSAEKSRAIAILEEQNEYLKADIKLLKDKLFGTSSEKVNIPYQEEAPIFNEFELVADELVPEAELPESFSSPKPPKKPGRKPLPASLARVEVIHDLSEEEKKCEQGHEMTCIGETTSEELEYIPATLRVIQHRCKKYCCETCSKMNSKDPTHSSALKVAQKPKQLIPKSIASPSLLAGIAVAKFDDYLPLYRQEEIFRRSDIFLSRQTMSQWLLKASEAVIPLINLLADHIRAYPISFADETTLQVLKEPDRAPETKSYLWLFLGGPPEARAVVYHYHPTRSAEVAETFFEGYEGAIHCDGYYGYESLIKKPSITGINCLAHARRKFLEACPSKKQPTGLSAEVLRYIGSLYHIENQLKAHKANTDKVKQIRDEKSRPILKALHKLLNAYQNRVPGKSKLGKAIDYMLKRWKYFLTYLEDGRYEIDNSRAERGIKPFVIGRKNFIFCVSPQGAHASARLYSLVETAKENGLNPLLYLTYLFEKLPLCSTVEDYEALLPFNLPNELKEKFKRHNNDEEESTC